MTRFIFLNSFLVVAVLLLGIEVAGAKSPYGPFAGESTINPALMQIDEVKFLGAPINKSYQFIDEKGEEFILGDMLGKPLILLFSYYSCDGTCPIINRNLMKALTELESKKIGQDYRVLTVTFDIHDTRKTLQNFLGDLKLPPEFESGWRHAIFKNRETDTSGLADSVGYRFFWSRSDELFLHPNAVILLTPEGRVARYLYGTAMDPKNLELGIIDADWGRIANSPNIIDILTGVCYSYNFEEGKYTINIPLFAGVGALLFGFFLVGFSSVIYKFTRRKKRLTATQGE